MSDPTALPPTVSVIIPTRNRPAYLRRNVEAVLAQSFTDLEVIVVDDGSQPPVDLSAARTTVVRQGVHVHACRARNIAADHARGRYLVCLDDDAELTDPAALATAVAFADAHPSVGVVAFRQVTPAGADGQNFAAGDDPRLVGQFAGCGALLRRDVFDRVGGFTDLLGYYYEELEYCMRVFDAGSLVAYHPGVRVVHYHDPHGRDWRRIHRTIARNAVLTIVLRFPWWAVVPAVAWQVLNYVRWQVVDRRVDPLGTVRMAAEVVARLPAAVRQRRPVRWASLATYKRYQRHPQPVPA